MPGQAAGDAGGVLAHGLGGRSDLPLDALHAIAGGGLAVLASFLLLGVVWRRPRLDPGRGRPLPDALARAAGSPAVRRGARAVVLAACALVVAVAFAGPRRTEQNLAPWALYVTFWVGLAPASVLLGPVWRAVNPLRVLHAAIARRGAACREYPARLGYWPAAAWLTGFVWLELVAPGRADPRLVGALILGYASVNLAFARVYGPAWFARGDGFEAYSTLLARMCPIGRRPDGTLILRSPLAALADGRAVAGQTALACVLIGSTGFDGLTRTAFWRETVDPRDVAAGTLGLLGCVAFVAALYLAAARGRAARFSATLLPIALGYTVAHYFSFFLLEGQMTVILASDPFGTGLDLLGLSGNRVDYRLLSPALVAAVQINAIVLGHIAATAASHDLALRTYPPARAVRDQIPVAAAMVALTCAGLAALLGG
ncbi:hypothetical protein D5H75_28715 [Bailinhaonella thermotolerans]|uniref:Uncharacterized protein n=1 Tax=Bailinhaonella thermotolerans TaxID=1070861 RepID=A0A3A4AFS4_9ACTN|nr:hypothetical protein D5H75_28715 [Bailinhaonella thermotolerans]